MWTPKKIINHQGLNLMLEVVAAALSCYAVGRGSDKSLWEIFAGLAFSLAAVTNGPTFLLRRPNACAAVPPDIFLGRPPRLPQPLLT